MTIDTLCLDVDGLIVRFEGHSRHALLAQFCQQYQPSVLKTGGDAHLKITVTDGALCCEWLCAPNGALKYVIDINKLIKQQFSYPAAKQGAFNQALGKKTKHILDATGGWGADTLLMCTQGYNVSLLERHPIMALLLSDAMQRLQASEWAQDNQVIAPSVINVDAIDYLASEAAPVSTNMADIDCVYLDPMFPNKPKKSAAVNKNMQFLQWLVGADHDAEKLASNAVEFGAKVTARVVVKRPDYADPLLAIAAQRFSSKLINYDVYLPAPAP